MQWLGDRGACGQQGLAETLADQLWDRTSPSNGAYKGLPVGELSDRQAGVPWSFFLAGNPRCDGN